MAVDYTKNAIAEIRDYLWKEIQSTKVLNKNDYIADGFSKPLVPIIPSQQIPEFNNLISGKPYIIYDFNINSYDSDFWMCEETLQLSIVSNSYGKVVELMNFLVDVFRRMDLTAKDVNANSGISSKFKFHYFYVQDAQSPDPVEEEGGNYVGYVDVTYKYSRFIDNNGRFL